MYHLFHEYDYKKWVSVKTIRLPPIPVEDMRQAFIDMREGILLVAIFGFLLGIYGALG